MLPAESAREAWQQLCAASAWRVSAARNEGRARLPLWRSVGVVLFPVRQQNALQRSCNAAEDARRKLIQAAT